MDSDSLLIEERINEMIHIATDRFKSKYPSLNIKFEIMPGRKYLKIVTRDNEGKGGSVWCFVDPQTGDVYKPASWRGPAKDARYNLLIPQSFKLLCARVDSHGSFLYK